MKRDMDLVRQLLLKLEDDPKFNGRSKYMVYANDFEIEGFGYEEIDYHLGLLIEAGLVEGQAMASPGFVISQVSWQGHEFAATVRDPAIWSATKDGAKKAGGFSLELLGELAKGFIKKKVQDLTGVKLDL